MGLKLNIIDRALMQIAPVRGLRRVAAKRQAAVLMNYDAATTGRRANAIKAPGTDADAASSASRARLRNISRDTIRNRPYAARAQQVFASHVVAAGIIPSVQSDDEQVKDAVTALVKEHLMTTAIDAQGVHTLSSMQRVVMNGVFSDGELLVRLRPRSGSFATNLPLPFAVELIEVDQLDTTKTANGGNVVVDGIEYDPIGRAVAYHILKEHPGATGWLNWRKRTESERVIASDILHIRRLDRPGQKRGVPWLAPVFLTLSELADYQEAQIIKQRMAALVAWFIESMDGSSVFQGAGIEEIGPGSVVGLQPGQKATATEPPTVEGYASFMDEGLHTVAAGLGITHAALTGKLKGINFTSGRMGRTDMDPLIETIQKQIIIDQFCAGIGNWFGRFAMMSKQIDPDSYDLEWTAPRRPLVDPNKEIPAMVTAIENGLTSRQREQRRMGNDPDVIEQERIEDAQRQEKGTDDETE